MMTEERSRYIVTADDIPVDLETLDGGMMEVMSESMHQGLLVEDASQADFFLRLVKKLDAKAAQVKADADLYRSRIVSAETTALRHIDYKRHLYTEALKGYFSTHRDEREKSLLLPHGRIGERAQQPEVIRDEKALLAWLEANAMPEYVKQVITEKGDWAKLKKQCDLSGEHPVFLPTGEEIPAVTLAARPPEFYLDFADAGESMLENDAHDALPAPDAQTTI